MKNFRQSITRRLEKYLEIRSKLPALEEYPITITLPDGQTRPGIASKTTPLQIAQQISKKLAESSCVARVYDIHLDEVVVDADDEKIEDEVVLLDTSFCKNIIRQEKNYVLWDMSRPLTQNCRIEFLNFEDTDGKHVFWHSSAHVLGHCLESLYNAQLTIGPALKTGFYYDCFLGEKKLSETDFFEVETKFIEICRKNLNFERLVLTKEEALDLFFDNPFKVHLITNKVPDGAKTSVYRVGDLIDLCRGPHLTNTQQIKGFFCTKASASYWLGDQKNLGLQRIYGISFPSEKKMKEYRKILDEAASRDHRKLGISQELFFFSANYSPGSCFWLENGAKIYNKLQDFMRQEYKIRGFREVITPNIYSRELFEKSGHYQNYRDCMYGFDVEGQEWFLKPMNCPGHCVVFDHKARTYRELPLRLASFGVLHRNEASGSLSGLTRVRRFQQDDAHIFCRLDQIEDEVTEALDFLFYVYRVFGFEYSLCLSTRPKKALGSLKLWRTAETQLMQALEKSQSRWSLNPGDGSFYGPKIDIQLKDAFGRQHQCGTIQLDFQLPIRFNLQFHNGGKDVEDQDVEDRTKLKPNHERPVIVHRAILGSVERFLAILSEYYGGKWPFWLSPRQVKVVPVSEASFRYAQYVHDQLEKRNYNSEVDLSSKQFKKKILEAQHEQYNYFAVVGNTEEEEISVMLRERNAPQGSFGEKLTLRELISKFESMKMPLSRGDEFDEYRK